MTSSTKTTGLIACFLALGLSACGGGGGASSGAGGGSSGAGGGTSTLPQIDGVGFKWAAPSYALALNHQHDVPATLSADQATAFNLAPGKILDIEDQNGWLSSQMKISFEGSHVNGAFQYPERIDTGNRTQKLGVGLTALFAHAREDRLLFVNMQSGYAPQTYRLHAFNLPQGSWGPWSALDIGDGWLLARAVLNGVRGLNSRYSRFDVQVIRLDRMGQLLGSQRVGSSNVPDFGYTQVTGGAAALPRITLDRHFDDALLSVPAGNWQADGNNPLISVNALWLPLDARSLVVKAPFWVKSDRFKRAAYEEQPQWSMLARPNGVAASSFAAWSPRGAFSALPNYTNFSSAYIRQGWLHGTLSADYQNFSLMAYGLNKEPASTDLQNHWVGDMQTEALQWLNARSSRRVLVGNVNQMYALSDVARPTPACELAMGSGRLAVSSDCARYDSFYAQQSGSGVLARNVPAATSVLSVTDPRNQNSQGMGSSSLNLALPGTAQTLSLALNDQQRHPGCTTDRTVQATPVPVISAQETSVVVTTQRPAQSEMIGQSWGGALEVTLVPYHYRAPVLCSQYKVSLDQQLVVSRSTSSQPSAVAPVLHPVYSRQLVTAPENGVYDAEKNIYRPFAGFVGSDSFRLLISDKTGQQEVQVVVTVQ